MSFSSDVKGELARIEITKKDDMLAEIAGFLRVSGSLRLMGGGNFAIVASTENPAIARHYKKLIRDYFDSTANLEVENSQMPGSRRHRYSLTIRPEEKSMQILRETGLLLIREGDDYISDGIYAPIVSRKSCKKAYLRGVFLGCGSVSNPSKSYHMEFVLSSPVMATDLKKLIGSFDQLSANITQRKENSVVYIKRADYISDMLGIMGANQSLFEFEDVKITRNSKLEAQRQKNCDMANVDRSVTAAEEQFLLCRRIRDTIGLNALKPALREVAVIRLERPDAGLTEIGEMLSPPVRKPAVSKRFSKIREIAEAIPETKAQPSEERPNRNM